MSNENKRINLTQYEESFGGLLDAVLDGTCTLEDGEGHLHDRMQVIIAELKRCYEELDSQHKKISELIEANTVKGEILDRLRTCDECGEGWDYHPGGADCEAERQQASE